MKQTCLFDAEPEVSPRQTQRWFAVDEQTQQHVVSLLVQMVLATQPSSDTEERDDGTDSK